MNWLSRLVDNASDYFAHRKGLAAIYWHCTCGHQLLLPFIFGLIYRVTGSNLFLHLGVIVAIFGMMLAWAL